VENLFGIYFTVGSGVLLLATARYLPDLALRLCMQFLGAASCLYVLVDIQEDLLRLNQDGSDAEALAQITGIPALLWGLVWGLVAAVMMVYAFYLTFESGKRTPATLRKERDRSEETETT